MDGLLNLQTWYFSLFTLHVCASYTYTLLDPVPFLNATISGLSVPGRYVGGAPTTAVLVSY